MNATAEAAKVVHQQAVTKRSQHLFRFHTELEQDLRRLMSEGGKETAEVFDETIAEPLQALQSLAEKGGRLHEGAVSLGEPTRENILRQVHRMAALYLAAFNNGSRCYPFFEPEEE